MADIGNLLTRGVSEVLPSREKLEELMLKKKIKVYLGIDPTGMKLHLGHSILLRKVQQFADLGHEVVLLFGTGTVLAGDPSQREGGRSKITRAEIKKNIATWKKQVSPIVDFKKVKLVYNADWLLKLNLGDILNIASNLSATQLIKRDMFQRRIKRGDTVWMHEVMYPLLQGYDSVVLDVDLEIGGTDQVFNMLVGRELQHKMNNREKYVLSVSLISGTDGNKMSKSSGNCVWMGDGPNEMYGKLMSINDVQIPEYLKSLTEIKDSEIRNLLKNPLEAKKRLAMEIVNVYHGPSKAKMAQKHFELTYQQKSPTHEETTPLKENFAKTVAYASGASVSQAKRLIADGAVDIDGKVIKDISYNLTAGAKIKIGKKIHKTIK